MFIKDIRANTTYSMLYRTLQTPDMSSFHFQFHFRSLHFFFPNDYLKTNFLPPPCHLSRITTKLKAFPYIVIDFRQPIFMQIYQSFY